MRKERSWTRRAMLAAPLAGLLCACLAGCTSRAVTVTSLPPGAEVSINRRVVGKAPVRVNYTHYGKYRIELRQSRYKTMVREEALSPPWYGYDPFAFFADNVIPARINDESYLHYVMEPVPEETDRESLMKRATAARDGKVTHPVTQETIDLAWAPPPAKPGKTELQSLAEPAANSVDVPAVVGPSPTAQLELPKELKAPAGITEKPPEATPSVPAETTATPEKEATASEPGKAEQPAAPKKETAATEPKKPAHPPLPVKRLRRTPHGEILIYDEPVIEDPGKRK